MLARNKHQQNKPTLILILKTNKERLQNYKLRGKKQSLQKLNLDSLNLVRLLLLDSREMKNVTFMSNKLLNAETHCKHTPTVRNRYCSQINLFGWEQDLTSKRTHLRAPWLWLVHWKPTMPQEMGWRQSNLPMRLIRNNLTRNY